MVDSKGRPDTLMRRKSNESFHEGKGFATHNYAAELQRPYSMTL